MLRRWSSRWLAALVAVSLVSCSDPLAPFEPEVTNATDNFQFQATGVAGVTLDRSYVWQNTGTRATIDHSTVTGNGLARIVIKDAVGATVYDANLVPSSNVATTVGVAGSWTIELLLTGFSGTLNFRVQKL